MPGLRFKTDPSPSLPDKPLNDPAVGPELIGGTVGYDGEHKLSGIKFGFGAEANATISAFNSLDDKDPDGILGLPVAESDDFKVVLPPELMLTEEDAWLKYRLSAKVKASVSGEFSPIEFKVKSSFDAIFCDFHVHPREENTRDAIKADIQRLRFAGEVDDVLNIKAKESLSYQVRAELTASVTLSWSDIIVSSVSGLSQLLNAGNLLALRVSGAASVKFHVGLVDDFRLVFTRAKENIRVAVKKSKSRESGVAAELGVTVKFADENAIEDVLKNVVESVAGQPIADIDKIFKKASFDDLSAAERKVVNELIKRLGLSDAAQSLKDLRDLWEAKKKQINDIIEQIATAKVALGFTYEYLRIRTEDTLLIANLPPNVLERFHNNLMLCDLVGLLEWVEKNPSALIKYLNQETLTRSQAWGFSLGVGPWKASGKDTKKLTNVTQRNINDEERIAFNGMRAYEGTWGGDKVNWLVDFRAEMPGFARKGEANACLFKYGLNFKWQWKEKKLSQAELETILDYALIWRIIDPDDVQAILDLTENGTKPNGASIELTFNDRSLRALLPLAVAAADKDEPLLALGKAMPYMGKYAARRTPGVRQLCYAPLWKYYFEHAKQPINMFPSVASNVIRDITKEKSIKDGPGLAAREAGTSASTPAYQDFFTFAGQVYYHGQTPNDYSGVYSDWLGFSTGLKLLNASLQPDQCSEPKTIEEVFRLLSRFWGQSLYVRTAGVFLMDLAIKDLGLFSEINRALTIATKEGDIVAFGSS